MCAVCILCCAYAFACMLVLGFSTPAVCRSTAGGSKSIQAPQGLWGGIVVLCCVVPVWARAEMAAEVPGLAWASSPFVFHHCVVQLVFDLSPTQAMVQ